MQQETSRTDSAIPIEMPRADTDSMKFLNCPSDCLPLWVADMDFRASEPIIFESDNVLSSWPPLRVSRRYLR